MPQQNRNQNQVRARRLAREWSQAELAARANISRAAVSAIEGERLVPSVATALSLAHVMECSVEELFSTTVPNNDSQSTPRWAWAGSSEPGRYWCGTIQGQLLFYPAEATPLGEIPHDGFGHPESNPARLRRANETLVVATCDPASGLLARLYERVTGFRLLVVPRSSGQALQLLEQGLVHMAGVHLAATDDPNGNGASVKALVSQPARLLRVASWMEVIAVGSKIGKSSGRGLLNSQVKWVGREQGSGARRCQDELLQNRPAPRRNARDHRGIAEAIRCGWADAGVCLELVAREAGLMFLHIRTEEYDLCYQRSNEDDPRVLALVKVIQSSEYRQLYGELWGYDTRLTGQNSLIK